MSVQLSAPTCTENLAQPKSHLQSWQQILAGLTNTREDRRWLIKLLLDWLGDFEEAVADRSREQRSHQPASDSAHHPKKWDEPSAFAHCDLRLPGLSFPYGGEDGG